MRLCMDCVRDILIFCETADADLCPVMTNDIADAYGDKWDTLSIKYTISKMSEGGLVSAIILNDGQSLEAQEPAIFSITWDGHQFLEKIRDEAKWTGVKKALSAIRNYSISAISAVAEGMTASAINAYFSGQK